MNNSDVYATILRYAITYVLTPIAARKGMDAVDTGNLVDGLIAVVAALGALAPLAYNLLTRPSSAAMEVAVQADEVMDGKKKEAHVQTPSDVPNIVIKASNQNIGHK